MRKLTYSIFILFIFLMIQSCGGEGIGGTEIGNPSQRNFVGQLAQSTSSNLRTLTGSCEVDSIVATNSAGIETSVLVDSDCGFTLPLTVNAAYSFILKNNGTTVATMQFLSSSSGLNISVIIISSGTAAINVGNVSISGGVASVSVEPLSQMDRDSDGISDFDDSDDDDDGIDDDLEQDDCDFDGFEDDFDDDDDDCDVSGSDSSDDNSSGSESDTSEVAKVTSVFPVNNAASVDIDEDIEVQLGCEVNESTVTSSSFRVRSDVDTIECDYNFSNSGTLVRCEPTSELAGNTTYSVSIDNISCANGSVVTAVNWSFSTGS